jgi:hypothetical protein
MTARKPDPLGIIQYSLVLLELQIFVGKVMKCRLKSSLSQGKQIILQEDSPLLIDKKVDGLKSHEPVVEGEHDPVILQHKPEQWFFMLFL